LHLDQPAHPFCLNVDLLQEWILFSRAEALNFRFCGRAQIAQALVGPGAFRISVPLWLPQLPVLFGARF
jgi:hypothetical protein